MSGISVIVPVYNTAVYLRKCVDSILRQDYPPWEVILIDDGSTDGSADICDEYARTYPGLVRAVHQKNQGSAVARNRGIEMSQHAYLSFIDSDDYIEPDMYSRLMRLMEKYGADMAAGEMWIEKPGGEKRCRATGELEYSWNKWEALIQLNSYRYLYTSFCNALFARRAIGERRFPAGQKCEDYYLLHRVIAACERVAYCSRPVYHYVQREGSNSRAREISLAPIGASLAQMVFFREHFPEIAYIAEADCAFSHMGIYTAYIRNGMPCPRPLRRELRTTARKYLVSALRNPCLPPIKKLQALAFCFAPPIYRIVIAKTEHR